MAKCTKGNLMGILADAEFAGKKITPDGFDALNPSQKVGYAGRSTYLHTKGLTENPSQAIIEQMQAFRDAGLKQNGLSGDFRDPTVLFGEYSEPIMKAGAEWKQTVLDKGLDKQTARKLWNESVAPVAEKQKLAYFKDDPEGYYKHMADKYFNDVVEGVEVFGGGGGFISQQGSKAAGFFTNYAPHIAIYDVGELVTKGLTKFGPWHFTKGLASAAIKSKGNLFGRVAENKALYFGTEFTQQQGKVKEGGKWLLEHINPQYYSNNLLVNASAEMGRSAGMDAAEAVRKVGFIKEIGNTPGYLRRAQGEVTWARYSTEAAKFFLDIHADVGRAIAARDPKAFAGAMGSVLTYHTVLTSLGGFGTSLPGSPELTKLVKAINDSEDEQSFFDRMDEAVPMANLLQKGTGVSGKRGLQIGAPAYGIVYGAMNGLLAKPITNAPKIIDLYQEGETAKAFTKAFESSAAAVAFTRLRGPWSTKFSTDMVRLGADYWTDEMEDAEKIEMFTGRDSVVGF